jgi:hypothetical protein
MIKNRYSEIVALRAKGYTHGEIGAIYGLTKTRIGQILKRGPIAERVKRKGPVNKGGRERNNNFIRIQIAGCSLAEWKSLPAAARRAYGAQRVGAARRGIEWKLTITEWWKIWNDSGRWAERGTAGYVMCRYGDCGPYSADNVYIETASHNVSTAGRRRAAIRAAGVQIARPVT